MKRTLAAGAILLSCISCSHERPNFSGTWVQVSGPTLGLPDPDLEAHITVNQEDSSTVWGQVTIVSKSNPSKKSTGALFTGPIDGSERRDATGTVSKTYWEGDTLVFSNNRVKFGETNTNVLSLDRNGMLVIESTQNSPLQSKPAKMKTVFKKIR